MKAFDNPDAVYDLPDIRPLDLIERTDSVPKSERNWWYMPMGHYGHQMLNEKGAPKYDISNLPSN